MKIGILTYHFSDNFGALFQAYGLRRWFTDRGFDAEFINYHPTYVEQGGSFDRPWKPSLWRKNATIAYLWLSHTLRSQFGDKQQRAGFDAFRRDYLGISGDSIRTAQELSQTVGRYAMLVCGSDQIWNPSIQRGLDPVYFLNIPGSEAVRKVAYAPSFGRVSIEREYLAQLHDLVNRLDGISVREETGIDILAKAGIPQCRAHLVPDPTILLGNFENFAQAVPSFEKAVFCYALRTDEVIREVGQQVSANLGLPLISARSSRQRWTDIGQGISPTPVEWLQWIANSEFVVSNSFHGIALSVVHNKPFIAVKLPGRRADMNARVENLLRQIGLSHRAVESHDSSAIASLSNTPIDWEEVNTKLAELRNFGARYLEANVAKLFGASRQVGVET